MALVETQRKELESVRLLQAIAVVFRGLGLVGPLDSSEADKLGQFRTALRALLRPSELSSQPDSSVYRLQGVQEYADTVLLRSCSGSESDDSLETLPIEHQQVVRYRWLLEQLECASKTTPDARRKFTKNVDDEAIRVELEINILRALTALMLIDRDADEARSQLMEQSVRTALSHAKPISLLLL